MTYIAEGHRGTVHYGRAEPTGRVAHGDVWVTWAITELDGPPDPGDPAPWIRQLIYVWDKGWQLIGQSPADLPARKPGPFHVHDQRWPWCPRRDEHAHTYTTQPGGLHLVDGKPAGPVPGPRFAPQQDDITLREGNR